MELALEDKKRPKINERDDLVERLLPELSNLHQIYEKGNIIQKQILIRGVFKDSLLWGEGMFRTTFIDPTFYDNLLRINEEGLLFYEQPSLFFGKVPNLLPTGVRSIQFVEDLKKIAYLDHAIKEHLKSRF